MKGITENCEHYWTPLIRPVTSLGHQVGRRVLWEGPKFLNYSMSNTFSRVKKWLFNP